MKLEEHIKRYDDRAKSIRNAIVEKKESQEVVELLRELQKYRAIFVKVGEILADNGYTIDDLDTIFGKANDVEVNADEDSD